MDLNTDILEKARAYEARYAPFIPAQDRPAYHFTPPIGWMNDPNGWSWYKGEYHLFFQYHPYDVHWGPMHWGHATSKDGIVWQFHPAALGPDQPYDKDGVFSGSAVELDDGRLLLMYTGNCNEIQPDGSKLEVQTQAIAIGDGENFEKIAQNPVLTAKDLPEGGSRVDFRDPKIWREPDGTFKAVIGNRTEDGSGSVLLYSSCNGLDWTYESLIDRSWNEFGRMWECPDYFELDGSQILVVSPQDMQVSGLEFHNGNNTMAIVGHINKETGKFERDSLQSLDYGIDYYAPQSLLHPDGRRIAIGWMENWDACMPQITGQRWNGQMSVPRELTMENGRLLQNPIKELEAYRSRMVRHIFTVSEETSMPGIFGRVCDVTVEIEPVGSQEYEKFEMKIASGNQHYTKLTYKPRSSILKIDRSHAGSMRDIVHERKCHVANRNGKLKLRILLDRFGVEVFVNDGQQVLSAAIHTPMSANGITFAVEGQARICAEKYDLHFEGETKHD